MYEDIICINFNSARQVMNQCELMDLPKINQNRTFNCSSTNCISSKVHLHNLHHRRNGRFAIQWNGKISDSFILHGIRKIRAKWIPKHLACFIFIIFIEWIEFALHQKLWWWFTVSNASRNFYRFKYFTSVS